MVEKYDTFTQVSTEYENGMFASCVGGMKAATQNKVILYGTKGYIDVNQFWKADEEVMVVDGNKILL